MINYRDLDSNKSITMHRESLPYISIEKTFDTFRDLSADERKRIFFVKAVADSKTGLPYVQIFWLNGLLMDDLYSFIEDDKVKCFGCMSEEVVEVHQGDDIYGE